MSLELIRGQVSNLVVTKGASDPIFEGPEKGIAAVAGVAAAATGQLLSAATLASTVSSAGVGRVSMIAASFIGVAKCSNMKRKLTGNFGRPKTATGACLRK